MTEKKPWRKVLYEAQDYPDNYVDHSFLEKLRKNLYTRTYDLWHVAWESCMVSQQISCVSLFVAIFVYMDNKSLHPSTLFTISSILTILGYIIYELVDQGRAREIDGRSRKDDLKSVCLVMGFVFGLSPVLKDLTNSISTDTIHAMTACMLLMNLLFHDYGASGAIVSKAASFNTSIFASVCLASRLPSSWHAFVTVIFAMQMFALFPLLRSHLKVEVSWFHVPLTWILLVTATCLLYPISVLFAVLLVLVHFTITVVCPFWFVQLQRLKNNIHGPWDEAIIQD